MAHVPHGILRTGSVAILLLVSFGVLRSVGGVPVSSYPARTLQNSWRVDLNNATIEELRLLPRVGPALARRIEAYRTATPFTSLDELARVRGIGEFTLNRIRPHATVNAPRP